MSLVLLVYLADLVDNLGFLAVLVAIFLGILWVLCIFALTEYDLSKEERARGTGSMHRVAVAAMLFALLAAVLPSKTTIYTAVALQAAKDIRGVVESNETARKALLLLNRKIDEQLKDTHK